jgi:hypothetical protein
MVGVFTHGLTLQSIYFGVIGDDDTDVFQVAVCNGGLVKPKTSRHRGLGVVMGRDVASTQHIHGLWLCFFFRGVSLLRIFKLR